MLNVSSIRPETRYGCPAADQVLVNRFYVVGYSYYFRQAKWAIEIVDPDKKDLSTVERLDNFRPDYRIPPRFRANLDDYKGTGYDRGHLVASANQLDENIQNSETFLLTNMSPQKKELNRQIWRELESEIRRLDKRSNVLETYVITGPVFDYLTPIKLIGKNDRFGKKIPVPSHFYKCILTEEKSGRLKMWAFLMPNARATKPLKDYRVETALVEQRAGMFLWDNLTGKEIENERNKKRAMW